MATFSNCLDHFNDFSGYLLKHFSEAADSLFVLPDDENSPAGPEQGYHYEVAFRRPLTDQEKEILPEEFGGVPVTTHIISQGYQKRMELE